MVDRPKSKFVFQRSRFPGRLFGTAVGDLLGAGGKKYTDDTTIHLAPIGLFYYDNPKKLREFACKSSKIAHTHVYKYYNENLAEKFLANKDSKVTEK